MKKKVLLSMALLSAVVTVGSAPLTSYASEANAAKIITKNGYTIIMGQGVESLNQTLKELEITIGNSGNFCWNTDKPVVGTPGIETPDSGTPDVETPDNGAPDNGTPDNGTPDNGASDNGTSDVETPDNGTPDNGTPDNGTPDVNVPETSVPETPDSPDAVAPDKEETDTDQPDADELSYAQQVAYLVNRERLLAGLLPLEIQTDITSAANVRAQEIKRQFSHTRPDGSNFSSVLKAQGVSFSGAGENIAWGQKSPEEVMNAWMNSDGHRANILNNRFKNIGVGYYQDERGVNYWVQLFTY